MNETVKTNTDSRDILAQYHARLVREAWLRAAVWGLAIGLLIGALIMGASWLSTARPDLTEPVIAPFNGTWLSIAAAIGTALLVTVLLYVCRFRPDEMQTARRLDAMGLEERAVTMLSAQGNDSCITAMQRADTAETLRSVPPKMLKISVHKIASAAACAALVVLCVLLIVPNVMGLYLPPETDIDEQAIIDELLDELRQDIDDAENVPGEVKETLHEKVDELEKQLDAADSVQEKMEMIQEASTEIHDIIERLQTHYQLGEALMEHENTEELGEAVKEGDADASEAAMEKIRDKIGEAGKQSSEKMSDTLRDIASDINEALEKAGKEGDPLSEALEKLSEELQEAADKSDQGEEKAASEQADAASEQAEKEISEALGQQKSEEQLGKDMQEAMNEANEALSENGAKDGKETGGNGKEKKDGPPEDQPPKPGSAEGEPVDTSDKTADTPIDDPYAFSFKDGETPYSSEFDEYFKREMAKLEDSGLSEDVKEMIARYYASIKTKTVE